MLKSSPWTWLGSSGNRQWANSCGIIIINFCIAGFFGHAFWLFLRSNQSRKITIMSLSTLMSYIESGNSWHFFKGIRTLLWYLILWYCIDNTSYTTWLLWYRVTFWDGGLSERNNNMISMPKKRCPNVLFLKQSIFFSLDLQNIKNRPHSILLFKELAWFFILWNFSTYEVHFLTLFK